MNFFQLNITINNLACTFRQNSDGLYMTLTSELYSSRQMTFNTLHLISTNRVLRHRYAQYIIANRNILFKREQCNRFIFDSQIDLSLFNRTLDPFFRLRH
jgi:hypothetical protein